MPSSHEWGISRRRVQPVEREPHFPRQAIRCRFGTEQIGRRTRSAGPVLSTASRPSTFAKVTSSSTHSMQRPQQPSWSRPSAAMRSAADFVRPSARIADSVIPLQRQTYIRGAPPNPNVNDIEMRFHKNTEKNGPSQAEFRCYCLTLRHGRCMAGKRPTSRHRCAGRRFGDTRSRPLAGNISHRGNILRPYVACSAASSHLLAAAQEPNVCNLPGLVADGSPVRSTDQKAGCGRSRTGIRLGEEGGQQQRDHRQALQP